MNRVGVTLCRGCCCGTTRKRPDIDHDAQRVMLQELCRTGVATLRESECLGPCGEANVVVVRPSRVARASGAKPVWIGDLDDSRFDLLLDWISAGGPGCAELPAHLRARLIPPERR